jgi:hypothetical protein
VAGLYFQWGDKVDVPIFRLSDEVTFNNFGVTLLKNNQAMASFNQYKIII